MTSAGLPQLCCQGINSHLLLLRATSWRFDDSCLHIHREGPATHVAPDERPATGAREAGFFTRPWKCNDWMRSSLS